MEERKWYSLSANDPYMVTFNVVLGSVIARAFVLFQHNGNDCNVSVYTSKGNRLHYVSDADIPLESFVDTLELDELASMIIEQDESEILRSVLEEEYSNELD